MQQKDKERLLSRVKLLYETLSPKTESHLKYSESSQVKYPTNRFQLYVLETIQSAGLKASWSSNDHLQWEKDELICLSCLSMSFGLSLLRPSPMRPSTSVAIQFLLFLYMSQVLSYRDSPLGGYLFHPVYMLHMFLLVDPIEYLS